MNTACTTAARPVHGRIRAMRRLTGLAVLAGLAAGGLTSTGGRVDSVARWTVAFGSRYWHSTGEARRISMTAPAPFSSRG